MSWERSAVHDQNVGGVALREQAGRPRQPRRRRGHRRRSCEGLRNGVAALRASVEPSPKVVLGAVPTAEEEVK